MASRSINILAMPWFFGFLKTIPDCDAILVAKIGDGPTDKLAAIGVKAVSDYAYLEINSSLLDYATSELAAYELASEIVNCSE